MPLTAAQLNAYLIDQGTITADQAKIAADETTETADAGTIASMLTGPVATEVVDPTTGNVIAVNVFTPTPAPGPGFTVSTIPLVS